MQNRFRIPKQLVEEHKQDIYFLVDNDKTHIQVGRPKITWVKPLGYEVNIDDTKDIIEALINELVHPKEPYFGTYVEAKDRITAKIKIPKILKRGKKTMEKFQKKFGKPADSTLMLTKGKGDDLVDDKEEKVEETKSEK